MADATMEPDATKDEESEEAEVERRLTESTLWKEDNLQHGHLAVWGSFYDAEAKAWGYSCCRSVQKTAVCTAAKEAAEAAKAREPKPDSEEYSTDSDDAKIEEQKATKRPLDWSKYSQELLPRSKFPQHAAGASAFVEHFVRFAIGHWREMHDRGYDTLGIMEKQAFTKTLPECMDAITPLLRKLKKGESLEKGERKENRGRCRETRTSMEGRHIEESSVLGQLEGMASMAYERSYVEAHKAYMLLTLGNKTWNNTSVLMVSACTMKGAREYRRNRDSLNTYDMDPVSQRYMHAFRKLVHFTQTVRPSDDQSKNIVL